ncbi:MAG TPA: hypothetical protein PKE31_07800 [Pseudomonadota bacterium]|nr:hypothetical protein [Pseudomonadota bacterium]
MPPRFDPQQPDEVAKTNPAVDPQKIQALKSFRLAMAKAGLAMTADYRIAPSLGVRPALAVPFGTLVIPDTRDD